MRSNPTPASRLAWADLARGGAMILVVFAHAVQLLDAYGWTLGWLDPANTYLTAIRMPLFFLISGVFAARAVRRSWPGLFSSRLALLAYVYLLWMLVRAIWFSVVPWPLDDVPPWLALAVAPVWPTNGLWFLYALILYLVLAKLTLRWPRWMVIALFAALSVAAAYGVVAWLAGGASAWTWTWNSIAMYGLFFMLGVHGSRMWRDLAARTRVWWAVPAAVAIPLGVIGFTLLPAPLLGVGRIALSVASVAACVVIAAAVARWEPFARTFVYIGGRTLPIYVVHAMLLAALVPLAPADAVISWVAVLVLVGLGVVIPLGLYRWLGPIGGVFNLPHPLARSLVRWRARREPEPESA
ncbi:acyltransferase family protein [Agromyces intestinalis]|uniref:Acyltransferase family protein n=1 Tax=Agromyces intestinalis TaxID=2592652 RepID=A0A5C1YDQ7_9MICO|nr:acyltransferase family protein [Agromyces intestinalis]QEO14184.1 acyltransferase family protein [Agromyces intestinalis]